MLRMRMERRRRRLMLSRWRLTIFAPNAGGWQTNWPPKITI
jgi:hypothetical protein